MASEMEGAMHAGPYLRWDSVSKLLIAEIVFIALPGGDRGQKAVVGVRRSTVYAASSFIGVAGAQAAAAEVRIIDSLPTAEGARQQLGLATVGRIDFKDAWREETCCRSTAQRQTPVTSVIPRGRNLSDI